MPASYPGTLRAFPVHVNTTEVIDASHVNELQDEVTALQTFTGTNPHVSSASTGSSLGAWASGSRTYATLADRLANIEAGHTADTHSQYVRFGGTETITGQKTFSASATFFGAGTTSTSSIVYISSGTTGGEAAIHWRDGTVSRWAQYRLGGGSDLYIRDMVNARQHVTFTPGATDSAALTHFFSRVDVAANTSLYGNLAVIGTSTFTGAITAGALTLQGALTLAAGTGTAPAASAVGDTAAGGTSTTVARSDHRHAREAFGAAPPAVTAGSASAAGAAGTPARSDHVHGLSSNTPTPSAVGANAAEGTASTVSRSDHVHGREAFAALTVSGTFGAAANGTATTVARGDHSHGFNSAAPAASAVGDVVAEGTASTAARSDHRHARESFGGAPGTVNATASSAGSAATPSRSDHNHSVAVGSVTAMASFGLTAADGSSTSLARADHNHGTPAAPTAASTGSVSKAGDTMTGPLAVPSPLTVGDGTLSKAAAGLFSFNAGLSVTGALSASTTVTGATGVFDGAQRVYSSNNPPPISAPVVIMPFYVGGSVGTGLRRPVFIAPVAMTLRGARSIAFAGSGTYEIVVNGAGISGAPSAFGTIQALNNFTDLDINVGDRIQLSVATASVDATDLSVTVDVVTR